MRWRVTKNKQQIMFISFTGDLKVSKSWPNWLTVVFDSMIRIILIFDDGKTKGQDVFQTRSQEQRVSWDNWDNKVMAVPGGLTSGGQRIRRYEYFSPPLPGGDLTTGKGFWERIRLNKTVAKTKIKVCSKNRRLGSLLRAQEIVEMIRSLSIALQAVIPVLAWPPGTGKTSAINAIANALSPCECVIAPYGSRQTSPASPLFGMTASVWKRPPGRRDWRSPGRDSLPGRN